MKSNTIKGYRLLQNTEITHLIELISEENISKLKKYLKKIQKEKKIIEEKDRRIILKLLLNKKLISSSLTNNISPYITSIETINKINNKKNSAEIKLGLDQIANIAFYSLHDKDIIPKMSRVSHKWEDSLKLGNISMSKRHYDLWHNTYYLFRHTSNHVDAVIILLDEIINLNNIPLSVDKLFYNLTIPIENNLDIIPSSPKIIFDSNGYIVNIDLSYWISIEDEVIQYHEIKKLPFIIGNIITYEMCIFSPEDLLPESFQDITVKNFLYIEGGNVIEKVNQQLRDTNFKNVKKFIWRFNDETQIKENLDDVKV